MSSQSQAPKWPDHRIWPVTRRLLAAWRWESERGRGDSATCNAYASVRRRAKELGVDILQEPALAKLAGDLLAMEDFAPVGMPL